MNKSKLRIYYEMFLIKLTLFYIQEKYSNYVSKRQWF